LLSLTLPSQAKQKKRWSQVLAVCYILSSLRDLSFDEAAAAVEDIFVLVSAASILA
jgi:hypothetical protein